MSTLMSRKEVAMKRTALLLIIITILSLVAPCYAVSASKKVPDNEQLLTIANEIIEWKSKSISGDSTPLLEKLSSLSGSTAADWYAFSLGRLAIFEGAEAYTDHLKLYVEKKYKEKATMAIASAFELDGAEIAEVKGDLPVL